VVRLAREFKNIVGIKEAGGAPDRVSQLRIAVGNGFNNPVWGRFAYTSIYGGRSARRDQRRIEYSAQKVSQMVRAFAAGDLKAAMKLHGRLFPIFRVLFIETNPVPVKAAFGYAVAISKRNIVLPLVR